MERDDRNTIDERGLLCATQGIFPATSVTQLLLTHWFLSNYNKQEQLMILKTKFNHSVPGVSSIGPAEFDKLNSGRCGRRRCSRGSSQRSKSRGGWGRWSMDERRYVWCPPIDPDPSFLAMTSISCNHFPRNLLSSFRLQNRVDLRLKSIQV